MTPAGTVSRVRKTARAPRVKPRARRPAGGAAGGPTVENAEVARILGEIADLLEIEGANPFRIRAYRGAARTVSELPEPVAAMACDPERLTSLPGIGEDLAGKIAEIARTGTLPLLGQLEHEAPAGAAALMHLPGLGPKRARLLCEELGIHSLAQLGRAARAGRVRELRGFGERTERKILDELAARGAEEHRLPRATAAQYGEAILAHLRAVDGVLAAEIAGSFRRCRETVGDLDILVCCSRDAPVVDRFCAYHEVARVLARGPTRASIRLRSGLHVDLRVLPERSFGAGLHYFTGSKAHNIAIRRLGQQRGLKINEYGVFRGKRWLAGRDEKDVFAAVGLPWIAPELREDRGEVEAARDGTLPHLLSLGDIRGDLQVHTTDSDGRDSLRDMAEAAQALGYEYLAITDHTPTVRIAGGLDRAGFRRQMRRIERLNARLRTLTVLAGAEVDIHADGSLDLDDDTLAALDVVVVSLHSHLDMPEPEQTRRILRALDHPSVDIFAHPTARLLGRRQGAKLDLDAVCHAAVARGVMIEVNAQPERLDLDDISARAAVRHGARLVVNTDAHAVAELRFMRWGVEQARRGWVEKRDVANALTLDRLLKRLHAGRR